MKKVKYIIYLLLMFFLFGYSANAQATLNVNTTSVTPGQSFTASVSMYNAAAWSIHVSASGPVSGCSINVADASSDAMNVSNTFTTTCTATGTGTITISLSGDTTDQNGNTSYLSGTKTVSVVNQTTVTPNNPTTPATPTTPSKPATPSNPKTSDTRSTNNNLKSLKVDGFELVKTGDTTYTLSVKNSVDHITIKAEKSDSKASVTGVGNTALKVGENKFNIVVTAENGAQKTYTITVTRRDSIFPLSDLKQAISDSDSDEVMISLNGGEVLKQSDMEEMRKSNKTFNFIKYDEDKKIKYSWIIDGKSIEKAGELNLDVSFDIKDRDTIRRAMNYAEGIYFNTESGDYPNDTKIKIYVGDMYENGTNLQKYLIVGGKRFPSVLSGKVEDGFISFGISNGGENYITQANYVAEKKSFNIFIPICIVEGLIILLLLIVLASKKNKNKKDEDTLEVINTIPSTNDIPSTTPVMMEISTPSTGPDFPIDPQ